MRTKLKVKNNACILQIDDVKLIAKNPYIQPFNSYIYRDETDIMYFYYDLILKKKNHKGKWKTIVKTYVTEFGIMQGIANALSNIIDFDVKENGIIQYSENDKEDYTAFHPFCIAGLLNEDRIEIIKEYKTFKDCRGNNEFENYNVNIFIGGNELSSVPIGVHFHYLEEKDIKTFITFSNKFMDIASEQIKKHIDNLLNDNTNNEYNYPEIVKKYLKNKYNINEWKCIFLKLSTKEYVLEEFVEYILGKKKIDELKCYEWHNDKRTMQQLLATMKDYEAFLYIIDDNTNDTLT
jgi:hypothetical protein